MCGCDIEFVEKSFEEMEKDMEGFLAESGRLKKEAAEILARSDELRRQSVDLRFEDPKVAEEVWQESERLREESKETMRQSVDQKIKASDVKHRLEIHDQITAVVDRAEELWKGAIKR